MDVTYIVIGLITIFSSVAIKYLIPYLKAKTGKENWDLIIYWADIFVRASEVLIEGVDKGGEKREQVLIDLRRKCDELGIKYSEEDIRSALESAWADMEENMYKLAYRKQ